MTPEIDRLRKTCPTRRVSTHIYGVSKEIDGKTFIFKVNLGMWPLKLIVSEKWALLSRLQHIYGVSKKIDGKTCMLRVNLGMWPLKSIVSENWALFWVFPHTFMGFQQDRWENVHVQLSSLCNRSSLQICLLYSIPYFSEILHCMVSKHVLAEKVAFSWSYSSKNP